MPPSQVRQKKLFDIDPPWEAKKTTKRLGTGVRSWYASSWVPGPTPAASGSSRLGDMASRAYNVSYGGLDFTFVSCISGSNQTLSLDLRCRVHSKPVQPTGF